MRKKIKAGCTGFFMPFPRLRFRQLFWLACIMLLPFLVLFAVTAGFVDVLPIFDNPYTGMTLLYTGFGYFIVALLFRRRPAYLFYGFYFTALVTLLAGVIAYLYYWHFAAQPPERLLNQASPLLLPPGLGADVL